MKKSILMVIAIVAASFIAEPSLLAKKLDWSYCPKDKLEYDDGDSFKCGSEAIRVLGIDTPETKHPTHGFHKDQPYGREATNFTNDILRNAKKVIIVRGGKDPYGRTLAHVLVDGELLGVKLIKASLAYENVSRYGDNSLPEFALQIKEASEVSPKPKFEDPHLWRKKNKNRKQ